MSTRSVCVLMDLPPTQRYYVATLAAIDHAAQALGAHVDVRVLRTDTLGDQAEVLSSSAILVGPGSPYGDPEAVLTSIRLARERGIPLVGT